MFKKSTPQPRGKTRSSHQSIVLSDNYQKYILVVRSLLETQDLHAEACIGYLPDPVSLHKKKVELILSMAIIQKITRDHGLFPVEQLVLTANDPDIVIKIRDHQRDKINLIRKINNTFYLIGANRAKGNF